MTEDERRNLAAKIRRDIRELEASIGRLEETVKPIPPDDAIGRLTRMEAIGAKAVSEANLRAARLKHARLTAALCRVDDPAYGVCLVCEEPIAVARLMLVPEATRCVACADP